MEKGYDAAAPITSESGPRPIDPPEKQSNLRKTPLLSSIRQTQKEHRGMCLVLSQREVRLLVTEPSKRL